MEKVLEEKEEETEVEKVLEEKEEETEVQKVNQNSEDLNGYSEEQIKKITTDINCQNFIIEKNKIYCWDGKKFILYKN